MQQLATIPISQIDCSSIPVNPKALAFALLLSHGHIFPPIKVERLDNGRFALRDGRHRFAAHKLLGKDKVRILCGKR